MRTTVWDVIAIDYYRMLDNRVSQVFPRALEILHSVKCSTLLDYGAGNGLFVENWLESSSEVMGVVYDIAPKMRELARKRLISFKKRAQVIGDLEGLNLEGSFDAVTLHAVWMCLPKREDCLKCLRTINKLLSKQGTLLASVTHPCFREQRFSTFRTSFEMKDYLSEGTPFEVYMLGENEHLSFTDYHWSLSEMSNQLLESGFTIRRIFEFPEYDNLRQVRSIPWLMIQAIKM